MEPFRVVVSTIISLSLMGFAAPSLSADTPAQAAAREAERKRVEKYDKPVYPDPLGNAIIAGGVAGVVRGAAAGSVGAGAAAAATGTATRAATGTAAKAYKDSKDSKGK